MAAKGVAFETVHYIDHPLSATELKKIFRSARLRSRDVLRTKEPAYQEHVAGKDLSDAQLLEVMARHPELIQRPIVVRGDKAVLARPVARLSDLGIE